MARVLLIVWLFGAVPAAAQTPAFASAGASGVAATASINAARELYAAARYDEALVVLDGLRPSSESAGAERRIIEQYRSFCLLALGRAEEAEAAIAAVVAADPFYRPGEAETSPRVRATFSEVRQRLLPDLAADRYTDAKDAYDRKLFGDAALQFRELVTLLDDPQMQGRQGDLRTLAAGFLELATVAAAPPPEPKPEPKKEESADPPAPVAAKIYMAEEPGIVAPVTIRQDLPSLPAAISAFTKRQGLLDLVIDEQGRLVSIAVRSSLHPVYDKLLVNAASDWKYRPATLNGRPVQFRKLLQITLDTR